MALLIPDESSLVFPSNIRNCDKSKTQQAIIWDPYCHLQLIRPHFKRLHWLVDECQKYVSLKIRISMTVLLICLDFEGPNKNPVEIELE